MLLVDIGGWAGWFGDSEEGVMFGLFCLLPAETADAGMLDCGRLRGPQEPVNQVESMSVSLCGDQKWIVCVMANKILVWQMQD